MRKLFTLRKFLFVFICLMITGVQSIFAIGDAGVQNIIGPESPVCQGNSPVTVIIHNYGGITISTATVHWKVNGNNQSNYSYAGNIPAGSEDTVTIGNFSFNSGSYTIVAYTRNPNGSPDSDPANDTATVTITVSTKLTGTYTIAGSSPDFPNFKSAVNALVANGICGPVTFNIRPYTDTMQCVITSIAGADSINTILFQSENGDSTSVILTYPSQDTLINNHLISLQGADYITLKGLTLQRTGVLANAHVVEFTNTACYNTVTNCRLIGATGTTINSLAAILYSSNAISSNDSMNTFTNNLIKNGSLGVYMNGINTLSLEYGTVITNNVFDNQYSKGIQNTNQGNTLIEGNIFSTTSTYAGYAAVYLDRSNRVHHIIKNKIMGTPGTGMYFVDCTAQAGIHGVIANNFIQSNDSAGISMVDGDYQDVVFNSVLMTGTNPSFAALLMRGSGVGKVVKNNILANTGGGYSYIVSDSAVFGILASNYNNLYKTGSFVGNYNGTDINTIAGWVTASGKDSNSVSINPAFASTTDLHTTSQLMDDRGTHLNNVSDDIDGEPRAAVTPDIGADEYSSVSRNVGIGGFLNPIDSTCGNAATVVRVIVTNTGGNPESGFPVTAKITGSATATLNFTHTNVLAPGSQDTISFATTFNSAAGGLYIIKVYTGLALDEVHANDTLVGIFRLFAPPANPATTPASICGPGTDTLLAASADTVQWYSAAVGGTLLQIGTSYIPPTVVASTTYFVSAKSVCEGPRVPITLTVLPVPNVTLGNDTSINQGGSVSLNAGSGFTSYLWTPGNLTSQTISVNATGCYAVRVTNGSGCIDRDTQCVTVVVPSDVGVTSVSSPSNKLCADDSMQVMIHVTNLGSDTATGIPITVKITGAVTTTFTDSINTPLSPGTDVLLSMGMIDMSAGGVLVITAYTSYTNDLDHTNDTIVNHDTIVVQPASPTGIGGIRCGPGIIVLISSSADSVYWYDSPSNGNLLFVGDNYVIPNLTTNSTFYAQAGNYCSDQKRTPISATIHPLPIVNLGPDTSAADSLVLDAGSFVSYQWSNFSTTQTITVYLTGAYSVCVSDSNGCSNCDTIDVGIFVGIDQISGGNMMNLYPNPAHSSFTIDMKNPVNENVSFTITNTQGQLLMFEEVKNFESKTFNVSSFSKGVYFLRIQSSSGSSVYRLVVE